MTGFNSRTRVGATSLCVEAGVKSQVSIHAPVWVRRKRPVSVDESEKVSIHAPVWVRLVGGNITIMHKLFQFTHPCGCDKWAFGLVSTVCCFNSRTRVGAT